MTNNPLAKYFRKPAIYIKLPTGGKFNPEIPQTVLDEVGVLPMTAVDEISMKNPDALLNGEALISVVSSCVPSIPDPRKLCNIDVEALYMAIQYATYGSEITHTHQCKSCNESSDFNIDINYILNRFPDIDKPEPIEYEDLKIHIRPPSVEAITRLSLLELEQQRTVRVLQDTQNGELEDETEITKRFYESFRRIAQHNIHLLTVTIAGIETPEGFYDNSDMITEFVNNVPTHVVDEINTTVKQISKRPDDTTKFDFVCPECGENDTVVLEVNPVNFFETGS